VVFLLILSLPPLSSLLTSDTRTYIPFLVSPLFPARNRFLPVVSGHVKSVLSLISKRQRSVRSIVLKLFRFFSGWREAAHSVKSLFSSPSPFESELHFLLVFIFEHRVRSRSLALFRCFLPMSATCPPSFPPPWGFKHPLTPLHRSFGQWAVTSARALFSPQDFLNLRPCLFPGPYFPFL